MSETVLILKTSAQGDGGVSGQLLDHFVQGLQAATPGALSTSATSTPRRCPT